MILYNNVVHYPSLKTMLMIEKTLRDSNIPIKREELKRRLPVKIMHQTLNLILKYFEEKKIITDNHDGILWINKNNAPNRKECVDEKNIIKMTVEILKIIKKFNVVRAGIFGSYARGEQNKDSDIDLVVEFKGRKSLLDLVSLQLAIEESLNKKADVITYNSINPLLKKRILSEEVRIL